MWRKKKNSPLDIQLYCGAIVTAKFRVSAVHLKKQFCLHTVSMLEYTFKVTVQLAHSFRFHLSFTFFQKFMSSVNRSLVLMGTWCPQKEAYIYIWMCVFEGLLYTQSMSVQLYQSVPNTQKVKKTAISMGQHKTCADFEGNPPFQATGRYLNYRRKLPTYPVSVIGAGLC